jgi:hypothetical protein
MQNPTDNKFRMINLENKGYQNRVGKCIGGPQLMKAIGFVEQKGQLVLGRVTKTSIQEWLQVITKYLNDKVIVVPSQN